MKRSEINRYIQEGMDMCRRYGFGLPPFAFWTPEEWQTRGHAYDEIRDCALGWDVTDFGAGRYAELGLSLFTVRNGNLALERYRKAYCQKLLFVGEGQVSPCHFHFAKMEDIICHAGGNLLIQVHNAEESGGLDPGPVTVMTDGYWHEVPAGTVLRFEPGQSITLPQRQYHSLWAEGGPSLVMEVSSINDDRTDNHRFLENLPRFPGIEEDEPARYLLCTEYPRAPQ